MWMVLFFKQLVNTLNVKQNEYNLKPISQTNLSFQKYIWFTYTWGGKVSKDPVVKSILDTFNWSISVIDYGVIACNESLYQYSDIII